MYTVYPTYHKNIMAKLVKPNLGTRKKNSYLVNMCTKINNCKCTMTPKALPSYNLRHNLAMSLFFKNYRFKNEVGIDKKY